MRRLLTRAKLAWIAFFALCWGLTPLMFIWADMERGYDSTGGEALIPMIPVIALIMTLAGRNTKEVCKREKLDRRQCVRGRQGQYVQGNARRSSGQYVSG